MKQQRIPYSETNLEKWKRLVVENRNATIEEKLIAVNLFFNDLEYKDDLQLWGKNDYWATLTETLNMSGGDCEDVTIAKYFTLCDLDIPAEDMRLTYVISMKDKSPHMVLTVAGQRFEEPVVLDSMNNYLFPISRRPDLIPVYSFNTRGYWLARKNRRWDGERIGGAEKLSLWQDLLRRMQTDRPAQSGG